MNNYVVIYLVMSIVSIILYSGVAYSNLRLSTRLSQYNGAGIILLRVLALLCIIVMLSDLFWVIVLTARPLFGPVVEENWYRALLVFINSLFRVVPGGILLYLWRHLMLVSREEH